MRKFGPEAPLPPEVTQLDDFDLHRKPEGAEKFAYILFDLAREFGAMDRYERLRCRDANLPFAPSTLHANR
jgi:hypothetical protein